jgi:hypothetical protein
MSSMRDLLEKMSFAGQAVGQKPGDQVRGSEPMPKKGGKQHPYKGRLVGANESIEEEIKEDFNNWLSEYGAPGSGIGNDTGTNPAEQAMLRQQQVAQKQEIKNQVAALVAQVTAARAQISQLNKTFPQGANPVEKAMSLRDIQAQKIGIQSQIEDLMSQIAALRSQAI